MVTGAFLPAMVIVAVWQCASARLRLRHLGLACGPVARTSPRVGIAVPCTKPAAAWVNPVEFAGRPDRHGAFVCTLAGLIGAADQPVGRSEADSRWPCSVLAVLGPPHPDVSPAAAVNTASAITQARAGMRA